MRCPVCDSSLTPLFTSMVCDVCDARRQEPTQGSYEWARRQLMAGRIIRLFRDASAPIREGRLFRILKGGTNDLCWSDDGNLWYPLSIPVENWGDSCPDQDVFELT